MQQTTIYDFLPTTPTLVNFFLQTRHAGDLNMGNMSRKAPPIGPKDPAPLLAEFREEISNLLTKLNYTTRDIQLFRDSVDTVMGDLPYDCHQSYLGDMINGEERYDKLRTALQNIRLYCKVYRKNKCL